MRRASALNSRSDSGFAPVQVIVNPLREHPADAMHGGEIRDSGLPDALQSAELPKQRPPSLRTEALD